MIYFKDKSFLIDSCVTFVEILTVDDLDELVKF